MKIDIVNRPGQSAAKVSLEQGEQIVAESGAMICMNDNVDVQTSTRTRGGGGLLKGLKRMVAGESLFLNTFTGPSGGGEVYLASTLVGDMVVYDMDGTKELIVQATSYVAMGADVDMDTSWQGFGKALFSGESMFWLRFTGSGPVILSAFGGIYERELDGKNNYVVDTGHIVAFENSMDFSIAKSGSGWIKSFLSGEGLVADFSGSGRLFCQTHNANNFGSSLTSFLKPKSN